jgi:hypothetical protein
MFLRRLRAANFKLLTNSLLLDARGVKTKPQTNGEMPVALGIQAAAAAAAAAATAGSTGSFKLAATAPV